MRSALVLVALALAGCIAAGVAPAAPVAREPFELRGCDYLGVFLRVPPDLVAPLVPSEFTPAKDVGGVAIVTMGALSCADVATRTETGASRYGWLAVNVDKPSDARLAGNATNGITIYQYQLQRFALDDPLGRALARAGVSTLGASVDLHVDALAASSATLDSEAARYQISVPASPAARGVGNVVYRWRSIEETPQGYALVNGQLLPAQATAGTTVGVASFSEGSVARSVFGPSFAGLASYGTGYTVWDGYAESFEGR